jgi:predicted phage terminase large subunit-like protein
LTQEQTGPDGQVKPFVWNKSSFPNQFVPHAPHPPQRLFLDLECREALYGGAAGGGKSDTILMGAAEFFEVPNYAALILRKSYADLALPGALMDRAAEWFTGSGAKWQQDSHTWSYPGKGSITFGYLEIPKHRYRYQSSEFQNISFDELTQFEEDDWTYMSTRLRRLRTVEVPLKQRGASNPGGLGHSWVKRRFITEGAEKGRVFIPAKVKDNPSLRVEEYEKTLSELPPVLRAQLLEGNWDVTEGGKVISRSWFTQFLPGRPWTPVRVRAWDLAATTDGKRTCGVLMSRTPDGLFNIEHVIKFQKRPGERDEIIKQTAEGDGDNVTILIEEEPASGGIAQNDHLHLTLAKWHVESIRVGGGSNDKVLRAGPFSAMAHRGFVRLVEGGDWITEYLDELDVFPDGKYMDQVDATTLAYNYLAANSPPDFSHRGTPAEPGSQDEDEDAPRVHNPLGDFRRGDRNRIGRDWIRGRRLHGES